jgi:hypothetical protein
MIFIDMKKIKLNENDIERLVKRIIKEGEFFNDTIYDSIIEKINRKEISDALDENKYYRAAQLFLHMFDENEINVVSNTLGIDDNTSMREVGRKLQELRNKL